MNIENFKKLVQALREAPADDMFTMGKYAHECGTPACALGHYASRKDLQQTFHIKSDGYVSDLCTDEEGHVFWDGDEVCEHFDISTRAADALFSSEGCGGAQTRAEALAYIENFCGCKL